jgi:hypothetical protein
MSRKKSNTSRTRGRKVDLSPSVGSNLGKYAQMARDHSDNGSNIDQSPLRKQAASPGRFAQMAMNKSNSNLQQKQEITTKYITRSGRKSSKSKDRLDTSNISISPRPHAVTQGKFAQMALNHSSMVDP